MHSSKAEKEAAYAEAQRIFGPKKTETSDEKIKSNDNVAENTAVIEDEETEQEDAASPKGFTGRVLQDLSQQKTIEASNSNDIKEDAENDDNEEDDDNEEEPEITFFSENDFETLAKIIPIRPRNKPSVKELYVFKTQKPGMRRKALPASKRWMRRLVG